MRGKKRKANVYLTDKEKKQLIKAYKNRHKSGLTGVDVAKMFKISIGTVFKHLNG